jgi:hypothetical protein
MSEYLRPWKLAAFALGLALLIVGAFHFKSYDWDVGVSVVMATLAYVTAPWALRVVISRRWKMAPAALICYWLTVDGSYVAYNAWRGHPVSAELRCANLAASSVLYLACAVLWLPRKSLRELVAELRGTVR